MNKRLLLREFLLDSLKRSLYFIGYYNIGERSLDIDSLNLMRGPLF